MTIIDSHAFKHGISREDIEYAWENYRIGAVRVPGEREVRIGFGLDDSEIEMVGALLENGEWLVYHAMTPPTKKIDARDSVRAKEVIAMADYKLANGKTLSAEDIERECAEYESDTWEGRLDRIHVGPAAIADEPLVTVTVKFPASMIAAVDERSSNRSDYIRRAVAAAIA